MSVFHVSFLHYKNIEYSRLNCAWTNQLSTQHLLQLTNANAIQLNLQILKTIIYSTFYLATQKTQNWQMNKHWAPIVYHTVSIQTEVNDADFQKDWTEEERTGQYWLEAPRGQWPQAACCSHKAV